MTPDVLRNRFPALEKVADEALELLRGTVSEIELDSGDQVISSGIENDTMYFICAGRVRVSLESADECAILGDFGPGQWIGEMGMIQPAPAAASVVALDDCVLLSLSHDEFIELRRSSPALTSVLLQMLCRDLSARLHKTVAFIDNENIEGDSDPAAAVTRTSLIEVAKNLLGIAARSGA